MPSPMEFRSRWVLVTGASSGLGREIARHLARDHGANLIIAARRRSRLEELARELEQEAKVQVVTVQADLSREDDVERLFREATDGREVYAVILNAGITCFGEHHALAWEDISRMLSLNVTSTVRLVSLFVPHLLETRQSGGVLLVSSLAGVVPVPYQAAYSGTKGFLINFGRCLWHELRADDVSVTTFVPGGISTELLDIHGLSKHFGHKNPMVMPADACARLAVRALQRRRYMYVPGLLNRASLLLADLLPRRLSTTVIGAEYRKALATARGDG